MIDYSIQFNGADGDYTNASVLRSIDGSTPTVIPATITTYGSGGDYADPILAAAAVGPVDDGNIQVLVEISDVTMNGLFRPNQSWPNLGVFMGDTKVTGESLVGRTLSNLASSRFCLAPSPNVSFQDLYISDGGVSKDRAFQNINGNAFTRIISTDETSGGSINPVTDSTGTTLNNCVVHNIVQDGSSVEGAVTINNTLVMDRIIARANNLLTFANSISLATDWYLGRPNDSGAESLVTNSRILQDAPTDEFGPGSTGNIVDYDSTSDFVNLLIGDYRISTESPLHALNIGPFFEEGGGEVTVSDSLNTAESIANDDSVVYVGEIVISGSSINSSSLAKQDSISFASIVNISDTVNNSLTVANNDNVYLVGELIVNDSIVNSGSTASDDSITLAATIIVNDSLIDSISLAVNDSIRLSGAFNVIDQLINSASIASNDSVSFSSNVVVSEQSSNSESASNNDNVSFVGSVVIGEQLANSLSLASIDSISFAGEVIITDSAVNSSSSSGNDFIQIGAFEFTVYKETNISSLSKSRNINSPSLSTNIDG